MKGVALSDLHLGHRRYAATTGGRNSREVDVERALDRAVENAIAADPDLITVAGDIVDHPRVSVHAIMAWRDAVRRIVRETEAHVVAIQGNHDAARTRGSRTPIVVPGDYDRVHIVTSPRRVRFQAASTGESVAVACFPFTALEEDRAYSVEPDESADVNVLCIHAPLSDGDLPRFYAGEKAPKVETLSEGFRALVAGDFHDFRRLHPDRLAFYSGAIERTSSDIWSESAEKGVVVYDTRTGEMELVTHEVRKVEDWALLDFDMDPVTPTPEEVNACLGALAAEPDRHGDAILRLKVEGFPREQRDRIDWEAVRSLKATCLHFQLDLRWSEGEAAFRDRRDGPARTIEDDARAFFADDDPAVRRCAYSYLDIGEEETPDTETSDGPQASGESPRSAPSDALQPTGGAR